MAAAKRKARIAYEDNLVQELKDFASKNIDDVSIDLTNITIAKATQRTKEKVQNTQIGFNLHNGTTPFLNDKNK